MRYKHIYEMMVVGGLISLVLSVAVFLETSLYIIPIGFYIIILAWCIYSKQIKSSFTRVFMIKEKCLSSLVMLIVIIILIVWRAKYKFSIPYLVGLFGYQFFFVALPEEIIFRTIILGECLREKKGALFISSIFFSVLHFLIQIRELKFSNVIILFLLGAVLGSIYLSLQDTMACVLVHFLYNVTIVLCNESFSSLVYIICYVFILYIINFDRMEKRNEEKNSENCKCCLGFLFNDGIDKR